MKWLLIEEYTPEDNGFIENAIRAQDSRKVYTPSVGFLKMSYRKLNKMFFDDNLPNNIEFKIETDVNDKNSGHTDADNNENPNKFNIHYISLNGTLMKSPHSWIETILHEMIHVDDFANHPEHFVDGYNEHGDWFMKQARRLNKFGFDIVEKDMDKNTETTVDDDSIKEKLEKSTFIVFGTHPISGISSLVKVDSEDKEDALMKFKQNGCKKVTIVKTKNLNSVRLKIMDISDIGEFQYNVTNEFDKRYGPFEEVETIDLTKIAESTDKGKNWMKSTMTVTKLPNGRLHIRT